LLTEARLRQGISRYPRYRINSQRRGTDHLHRHPICELSEHAPGELNEDAIRGSTSSHPGYVLMDIDVPLGPVVLIATVVPWPVPFATKLALVAVLAFEVMLHPPWPRAF
jgi:hypothetical protein